MLPSGATFHSQITHRCEEEEIPGYERVTITLHAPPRHDDVPPQCQVCHGPTERLGDRLAWCRRGHEGRPYIIAWQPSKNGIGFGDKECDVLPILVHALGICSADPSKTPEEQAMLEVCRQQIINNLKTGSQLPPMRFINDDTNTQNACLRVWLYVPKVVTDQSRKTKEAEAGISLANEVARSGW